MLQNLIKEYQNNLEMYYNTNQTPDIKAANKATEHQEKMLLSYMRGKGWLTQYEIRSALNLPPQSVSRACRNLTKQGKLEKSDRVNKAGEYGKNVHTWRFTGMKIGNNNQLEIL